MKRKEVFHLRVRGIRGAIQVEKNEKEYILEAASKLLSKIAGENHLKKENVVSIFFTATPDINAEFPAYVVRKMGWKYVPVLCAQEMDVPRAVKRVIRVLVHASTPLSQEEIKHQYLGRTKEFRPDLTGE
ncbi:MAG: chorismate mutase [Candidatus Aminicenantales bacterium]